MLDFTEEGIYGEALLKGLILSGVGDLPMILPILNSVKLESCPTEAPLKLVC